MASLVFGGTFSLSEILLLFILTQFLLFGLNIFGEKNEEEEKLITYISFITPGKATSLDEMAALK